MRSCRFTKVVSLCQNEDVLSVRFGSPQLFKIWRVKTALMPAQRAPSKQRISALSLVKDGELTATSQPYHNMGPRIVAFASHVRNDGKICSTQGSLLHGTFLCLCLHTRKNHGKLSFRTGENRSHQRGRKDRVREEEEEEDRSEWNKKKTTLRG